MKKTSLFVLCVCLLALPACETFDGMREDFKSLSVSDSAMKPSANPENLLDDGCPKAEAVKELATFTEFSNLDKPTPQGLVSHVQIGQLQSACEYSGQSVTVDLKLAFEGSIGPAGRASAGDTPFFSYPFFVAVTGPSGGILAKEVFAASVTYPPGQDYQTYSEDLRQIIPIPNKTTGAKYKVLVGFQISPSQLAFNRAVMKRREEAAEKAAEETPPATAPLAKAESPAAVSPASGSSVTAPPPPDTQGPVSLVPPDSKRNP